MPRISAAFFTVGVLCVLTGMIGGMAMGATNHLEFAPAHAHLNLLGWVTMALYGTFYALTRDTLLPKLAWTQFCISTAGTVVMVTSLFLLLAHGNDPKYVPGIITGAMIATLGMLIFFYSVVRELLRKRA